MIRVVELFAGVGGFRVALERASNSFCTIWANQWEPDTQKQYAYDCYSKHFDNCVNEDINIVRKDVPDHDLLVAGFPCQSYSVARTSNHQLGLDDLKKGQLWWCIHDILERKRPRYVLLENVDRLLKSPTKQRGRDFGIILKCLHDLNYTIYWRVINAADYGFAQKRRRVFIFATQVATPNIFLKAFPCEHQKISGLFDFNVFQEIALPETIDETYKNFAFDFGNSGSCSNGIIKAETVTPIRENPTNLLEILDVTDTNKVYLTEKQIERFKFLKGSKSFQRVKPNGEPYTYTEGAMAFPDRLESPGRTMLTSEGSVNRCSHVVDDGGLRFLTPRECERLNGFADDWTINIPNRYRYFCMGNALVVGLIERIGYQILDEDRKRQILYTS